MSSHCSRLLSSGSQTVELSNLLDFIQKAPTLVKPDGAYMLQTVPLRACLCVERNNIIKRYKALVGQVFDGMLKRDPSEARKLNVMEGPVELHVRPDLDLVFRLLYNFLGE